MTWRCPGSKTISEVTIYSFHGQWSAHLVPTGWLSLYLITPIIPSFRVAWRQTPETGSGVIAFTNWAAEVKYKNVGTQFGTCNNTIYYQVSIVCRQFIILSMYTETIKKYVWNNVWRMYLISNGFMGNPAGGCQTNNWVKAHVGEVIIVWRNMHNNPEPNAIWFPAMLTDRSECSRNSREL